jgi:tryptophan synthase beta chain
LGKCEIAIAGRRKHDLARIQPNHAIRAVIDEAIRAREAGESKVIPSNLSGHGHFDMQAYHAFLAGRLPEIEFEEAALADGLTSLQGIPVPG